jgi:murein DD-endopeptidase MepM/ murein hydrolase activator NlpD
VVTTAVVGAGVVALGSATLVPDAKLNPNLTSFGGSEEALLAERAEAAERASRATGTRGGLATSISQQAPDVYLLPVHDYTYTSGFGYRWETAHNGVDLAAPEGTPIYAVHAGTVVLSRWYAGYGYAVILDHGDGVQTWYGHSSALLVEEGQQVSAGEHIALVGNTGYSFGAHLHFEVHVDDIPQDPIAWMQERGVDILSQTEEIYGAVADS